ncbi:MAG: MFS transporter [Candidatus Latescibacterota bacterium]|jgi:UMF1 family MFS transporter
MNENNKKIYAWAFYDWANSAYAASVMAAFFPIFFREYWNGDDDASQSTFKLGIANSLSSLVVVIIAPILGAIADQGGTRRQFLFTFAFLGILMTGCLYMVERGDWMLAMMVYVLATIGFSASNTFYDSLLVDIATADKVDFVSAFGYSLGYLGGGLLFAFNVYMVISPHTFNLPDSAAAVRYSFLGVALWWALFSIPIFLFVKEKPRKTRRKGWSAITGGYRQLSQTFSQVRQLRATLLFLVAYWLYIDGVDTIVRMAVDYGLALGFASNSLLVALGITQFVGFPAAIIFGKIGERMGARTGIFIGLGVYAGTTLWGYFMQDVWEFYILAVSIGLVQGGVQALSRSLYSRLIPRNKAAEFFGFYNMLGKFAAVIGPALMGWVGVMTGAPRASILSLILLFAAGGFLLARVDIDSGQRAARALEEH